MWDAFNYGILILEKMGTYPLQSLTKYIVMKSKTESDCLIRPLTLLDLSVLLAYGPDKFCKPILTISNKLQRDLI